MRPAMNHLAGRHVGLDGIEEANELLMAMALHVATGEILPSNTSSTATAWWCRGACNSWVMMPARPRFVDKLGWV
jgi:hypothetical protein